MNTAAKNAAARKPRAKKAPVSKAPADDRALAKKLLAAVTIPDKAWATARGASRIEGESRSEFIRRVLLGENPYTRVLPRRGIRREPMPRSGNRPPRSGSRAATSTSSSYENFRRRSRRPSATSTSPTSPCGTAALQAQGPDVLSRLDTNTSSGCPIRSRSTSASDQPFP